MNLSGGCRSTYVPLILRLAATLEILGGGGYQWLTGNDFGVALSQGTLSKIIAKTTSILEAKLCPLWIKWSVLNENAETKQFFHERFSIPGVVGCIDGTHLYFQRPPEDEQIFFNRKGKHSLNAMVICDHRKRIMAVNARYGGSAHDSLVWKHSNERAFFEDSFHEREHNCWLLGDSGYPLEPWLITPYRSSSDQMNTHFNNVHSKARSLIERCIGLYKGRWRILLEERKSSYDPCKMATFANVCAALHNICIHYNLEWDNIALDDEDSPSSMPNSAQVSSRNNRLTQLAIRIRDDIRNGLFN